jgi:alpha-beta hydrolase superfamily lysophospholipase
MRTEKLFLTTKDNIKIAADLYPAAEQARYGASSAGWAVLIHMMPATKESWQDFATESQNLGYESIAIDLRGHGESDGGPEGFLKFSDSEHQNSILDLEAAIEYLVKERQAKRDNVIFIGASIGANLSLQYLVEHSEFKTAILLSPGLNYRGIKTESLVQKLKADQKVFFVSAEDDGNNAKQNQKLFDLTPAGIEKQIKIYQAGGHGTDILENQQELINLIIDFIRR